MSGRTIQSSEIDNDAKEQDEALEQDEICQKYREMLLRLCGVDSVRDDAPPNSLPDTADEADGVGERVLADFMKSAHG